MPQLINGANIVFEMYWHKDSLPVLFIHCTGKLTTIKDLEMFVLAIYDTLEASPFESVCMVFDVLDTEVHLYNLTQLREALLHPELPISPRAAHSIIGTTDYIIRLISNIAILKEPDYRHTLELYTSRPRLEEAVTAWLAANGYATAPSAPLLGASH